MSTSNRTLKQRAYHEMKEFLAISGYLFVVLSLFALYKAMILADNHNFLVPLGLALINALVLGKVMLVAHELHFADWFKEEPLIYPTLFKSAIFAVVLASFKILEEAAIGLYHGQSFHENIAAIGGGTLKGIITVTAICAVVLIPFFGFTELRTVFDEGKLEQLFFTSRHSAGTPLK